MKKYFPLICALIAAAIMLQTLYFKFTAQPESVELFTKLGMEPFGRIAIGVLELIASVLLLLPKSRQYGALLGLGLMSGALFFHLTIIGIESKGDGGQLFCLAAIVWLSCFYLAFPLLIKLFRSVFRKPNKVLFLGAFIVSLFSVESFAQGCSDAGFCSVGEMKSEVVDSTKPYKNRIALTPFFGIGEDDVIIFTPTVQYDRQINNAWSIQSKITGNYASGNLGTVIGAGDFIQSFSYAFQSSRTLKLSLTAGVKVPLNNADQKSNGRSLPMTYQSSLGTLDLIAGAGIKYQQFKIALGMQIPVTNLYSDNGKYSTNGFLQGEWDSLSASPYPSTNGFIRSPDALLKLEYVWKVSNKFTLLPGVLNIVHLTQDRYSPTKGNNLSTSISKSQGLTTNFTLVAAYQFNKQFKASLTFGAPLIVRDVRPDGLTRRFVLGPEFSFNF